MPPRLPMFAGICRTAPMPTPLASFLLPFLQARSVSILSSLSDNPGAYNRRIRVGRGPSSGKGKTSGRGHKGQKQHGKVPARFQGGQTPLYIAHGVRGFENQYGPTPLFRSLRTGVFDQLLTIETDSQLRCLQLTSTGYSLGLTKADWTQPSQ